MDPSLTPSLTIGSVAADLRRVADLFDQNPHLTIDAPGWVHLDIQPGGPDGVMVARTNALAALLGGQARAQQMGNGTWHYDFETMVGDIQVHLFDSISEAAVRDVVRSRELAEKEAEIARLRAEVKELRATVAADALDALGLGFSRAVDGPDDPTPVSPARVPLHTGGMTDDGLVDESETVPVHMDFTNGRSMCGLSPTTPHRGSFVWADVTCTDCKANS